MRDAKDKGLKLLSLQANLDIKLKDLLHKLAKLKLQCRLAVAERTIKNLNSKATTLEMEKMKLQAV